jgi:hypothetical protein
MNFRWFPLGEVSHGMIIEGNWEGRKEAESAQGGEW